jgi:dipeptidyl aminopeptidase/acylaminoacyl peptidase
MADPDWIGPPVEDAWWRWDGRAVQYRLKRDGSPVRDTWQVASNGGTPMQLGNDTQADRDSADVVYDRAHHRTAFIRNGDVFLRDLGSGRLQQLTRSEEPDSRPQFGHDGSLVWRAGNTWYRYDGHTVAQAADVRAEDDPDAAPKPDLLRERQLALMQTLARERVRRDALTSEERARAAADPSRAPLPVYLGKDVNIVDSALSPNGRWLLVVTEAKGDSAGQSAKLPRYVTDSGYVEVGEARTLVNRNPPLPHTLWLVDIAAASARKIGFGSLPGITTDPLAELRKAAGQPPLKGERAVRIETDGDGTGPAIHWNAQGDAAAVLVRAVDNKDRWIISLDLARGAAQAAPAVRDHLHDPAWINWDYNDFGWMPDGRTLWYLSEATGFSHLYLNDGRSSRMLNDGRWEASQPQLSPDGKTFWFVCNRARPISYELCAQPATGGALRELTALGGGVEDFTPSPDGSHLLLHVSAWNMPPQLAVIPASGGSARQLTDTRSAQFKAMPWIAPAFVQVPSKHFKGAIWGKYYGPAQPQAGKRYPVVMFVHGAGYLQEVSQRWSPYFREQMFHNLLVRQGYIVLDLDYRASQGYGRDWRTAIYRNMGHPELEDYLDGLDWLVATRQGDRDRAGIYGGSYGGFMTYMALFRAPGVFKAGAALRPVADWTQYNHEYTSNILNTPDIDPEAFKRSSPIEYAANLQDHLLIAQGMVDNNVFFKDSVDMTQRLIELRKDHWSIAPYPMESHGFVHADSWYDEYRRIDELFNDVLKP